MTTTTTTRRQLPGLTAGAQETFARDELRFVLMDPLAGRHPDTLGHLPLPATGDRSAMGLLAARTQPVARVDLAVAGGVGHAWIRVRPELRGRGIGSQLLDVASRHARLLGVRCLHADVRSGDTRALHLLERIGTPRTLRADHVTRTVCTHLVVAGGCDAGRPAPVQCLCPAALRPHPPHRLAT